MAQSANSPEGVRIVFSVSEKILKKTTKCQHEYSCLETGRCGDGPMCAVEMTHGVDVLCVHSPDWPACQYHLDFGGARFCVCPVHCEIYRQQTQG